MALSKRAGGERWLARRMTLANSGLLRARPRRRTRPRCGTGPDCWQDVNHSSHSSKAVQGAEILVHARLRKSELIDEPCVVKDSGVTVHVIRRTKLPIGGAGRATGDTVKIALPSPAHGVAHADVDGIRHKTEFVSYRSHCHIKNLAPDVSLFHWEHGIRIDRRCGLPQLHGFAVSRYHSRCFRIRRSM